ncbi:MAG: cyclic lactone autoinducer peptide [Paenibacillus sp.]|nr:cyclic lactone autoinducer peptide [Paenibacillus sp.]
MFKKSIYALASSLSFLAVIITSSASFLYIYQGQTPDELLK